MSTTDQFYLALKAYQEIQTELPNHDPTRESQSGSSSGRSTELTQLPGIPDGSLLLGLAEDGLPLLLDLYDPAPGPILVAGDGGTGKTALLQSLAYASDIRNPGEIQFGILTPFPEEWAALEVLPNSLGVWPTYHPSAGDFLSQLVGWTETLPETRQVVLLLMDGLDLMIADGFRSQRDLRWLLTYGPDRQVWPIVSVNPGRLARLQTWLEYFHTRILGRVQHEENARLVNAETQIDLSVLQPGIQFGLSQPGNWLKFRLPPLGQGVCHERWNALVR